MTTMTQNRTGRNNRKHCRDLSMIDTDCALKTVEDDYLIVTRWLSVPVSRELRGGSMTLVESARLIFHPHPHRRRHPGSPLPLHLPM